MDPRNPKAKLVRQLGTFNLKASPLDYENIKGYIGKLVSGYRIVGLGGYLQLYRDAGTDVQKEPAADDPRMRMMKFQTKQIEKEKVGWKLHISVNPQDIEKAWALIHPTLTKFEITGIKLVKPSTLEKDADRQKQTGKQFTIYQFMNLNFDKQKWEEIIKQIEEKLQENGIRPGDMPKVNQAIQGSSYFSYRNDTHPETKEYIEDDAVGLQMEKNPELKPFNLIGAEDPFEKLSPFEEKKEYIKK